MERSEFGVPRWAVRMAARGKEGEKGEGKGGGMERYVVCWEYDSGFGGGECVCGRVGRRGGVCLHGWINFVRWFRERLKAGEDLFPFGLEGWVK